MRESLSGPSGGRAAVRCKAALTASYRRGSRAATRIGVLLAAASVFAVLAAPTPAAAYTWNPPSWWTETVPAVSGCAVQYTLTKDEGLDRPEWEQWKVESCWIRKPQSYEYTTCDGFATNDLNGGDGIDRNAFNYSCGVTTEAAGGFGSVGCQRRVSDTSSDIGWYAWGVFWSEDSRVWATLAECLSRPPVTPVQDADGDELDDDQDNCPSRANPDQEDWDKDGRGDACDADDDNDGVDDTQELEDGTYTLDPDSDNDGVDDGDDAFPLDPGESEDTDGDGVGDEADNCRLVANPGQADTDADGQGDACSDDGDHDSHPDDQDNCAQIANPAQEDADGDGQGDACDPNDTDGPKADPDGDGYLNSTDNCRLVANGDQIDRDGDGRGAACDPDDAGAPPAAVDTQPPVPTVTFRRQELGPVLKRGFAAKSGCNERCTATVELVLGGKLAKRLKLSRTSRPTVVGRASRAVAAGAQALIRVKLTRKAREAFSRLRSVRLTVRSTAVDLRGNRSRPLNRGLTLER